MFGGILNFFIAFWWVKNYSLLIPQQKTGQIKSTASNLKKKSGEIIKIRQKLHSFNDTDKKFKS